MSEPTHEPVAEGKTLQDWAFRAHCRQDGEPWPCRTALLAELAEARADALDVEALAEAMAQEQGDFVGKHSLWEYRAGRVAERYRAILAAQKETSGG